MMKIMSDPNTSNWLKAAIKDSLERNPVEVIYDCEVLIKICQKRLLTGTIHA
jgi:hypothetical protein